MPERKHQKCVDNLVRRLMKIYNNSQVFNNEDYDRGECDVLVEHHKYHVYYEIKTNHTQKGYIKAIEQLTRWSRYMRTQNNTIDYYGVYHSPSYGFKILCKNGVLRPNVINKIY